MAYEWYEPRLDLESQLFGPTKKTKPASWLTSLAFRKFGGHALVPKFEFSFPAQTYPTATFFARPNPPRTR